MKKLNKKKGFTLVEMLVVIAIIAVLVAIIVPTVSSSTNKAKAATNAANLRSVKAEIGIALLSYDVNEIPTPATANNKTTITFTDTNKGNTVIEIPACKTIGGTNGIAGGAFSAKLENGDVVVLYGTDGTIEAYAYYAENGKKPS